MCPANTTKVSSSDRKSQYHPSFGSSAALRAAANASASSSRVSNSMKVQVRGWPASTSPASARQILATTRPTPSRDARSEEHTSELQSHSDLVCRLLLEKKNNVNPSA